MIQNLQSIHRPHNKLAELINVIVTAVPIFSVFLFAIWWFRPENLPQNFTGSYHLFDYLLFLLVSYVVWHPIVMEVLSWCISSNIKPLIERVPEPGHRVAFITTIVPHIEPKELLHKCLPAMVKANYNHDTWLLDEGNDPEVKEICRLYGVKHFTRHGVEKFNTTEGKYTRTKGGNHNSWYETYGNDYDFVAQIDTDFVPDEDFLIKTLGHFKDPKVAFVGTPQIYGNTHKSLVALGASQQLLNFYGAILRGLSGMGMNMLIGANHVLRVEAFKQVGHYTAHITEDLITGMKLHAHGWRSVYVPYALAIGEGPANWESYFNQQFRWAYGCIDILFRHSWDYYKKMPLRQSIYYFLLQQHYFSGVAMAISTLLISFFFSFGIQSANIDLFRFVLVYTTLLVICWLMSVWLQKYDVEWKNEARLFLAGRLVSIAAWPIWFLAFVKVLSGNKIAYKITPKGDKLAFNKFSLKTFKPHLIFVFITIGSLLLAVFTRHYSAVMFFWAISSILLMLMIPFAESIVRNLSKVGYSSLNLINNWFVVNFPEKHVVNHPNTHLSDSLFLFVCVIVSALPYINRLGFYSDDWAFLGNFIVTADKSIFGLFVDATTPNTFMRPLQNLYDAALFYFFGLNPLGYHIINTLVFSAIILLLYKVLTEIKLSRIIAVTLPLIFAFLPHYSTNRFWYASFQVNLSMLLFLFSTLFGLKSLNPIYKHSLKLKILSIIFLIASALSYEVMMPFVLLNAILFWNPFQKLNGLRKKDKNLYHHGVFISIQFLAVIYMSIFKALTTTRLGSVNFPEYTFNLWISIFKTNFVELGLKIPLVLKSILIYHFSPQLIFQGISISIFIFYYLFVIFSDRRIRFPKRQLLSGLSLLSIFIFFLGYAVFFVNNRVGFSPTGIDNRVSIGAALGIALMFVSLTAWLSSFFSNLWSKWLYSLTVALACAVGFLIINSLANYWVSAYQESNRVLTSIQKQFTTLPSKSILIVDGVCPYVGPGIVFESMWDLKGALQTIYKDKSILADVVTPRMKVYDNALVTQIYTFQEIYPYKNLMIYNYKQDVVYNIPDRQTAQDYFNKYNPDMNNGCPPSSAGNGVSVFN